MNFCNVKTICSACLFALLVHSAGVERVLAEEELFRIEEKGTAIVLQDNALSGSSQYDLSLSGSSKSAQELSYFLLDNPRRVVVDLRGGEIVKNISKKFPVGGAVAEVRLGRHDEMVRIVVELHAGERPGVQVSGDAGNFSMRIAPASHAGRVKAVRFHTGSRSRVQSPGIKKDRNSEGRSELSEEALRKGARLKFVVDRDLVVLRMLALETIQISNPGEDSLYLQVEEVQVVKPGTDEEHFSSSTSLQIVPREFTVAPGSSTSMKISLAGQSAQEEQLIRLNIFPRSNSLDAVEDAEAERRTTVGAGLSIPVYIPPQTQKGDLSWERSQSVITLSNAGNYSVLLEEGQFCSQDNNCEALQSFRMYPGNTVGIELPENYRVELIKSIYGVKTLLTIPSGATS